MDELFSQLDMLDAVLAVFGALIVSMWFGSGKNWKQIVFGAAMGGLVKPVLFTALAFGGIAVLEGASGNLTSDSSTDDMLKLISGNAK